MFPSTPSSSFRLPESVEFIPDTFSSFVSRLSFDSRIVSFVDFSSFVGDIDDEISENDQEQDNNDMDLEQESEQNRRYCRWGDDSNNYNDNSTPTMVPTLSSHSLLPPQRRQSDAQDLAPPKPDDCAAAPSTKFLSPLRRRQSLRRGDERDGYNRKQQKGASPQEQQEPQGNCSSASQQQGPLGLLQRLRQIPVTGASNRKMRQDVAAGGSGRITPHYDINAISDWAIVASSDHTSHNCSFAGETKEEKDRTNHHCQHGDSSASSPVSPLPSDGKPMMNFNPRAAIYKLKENISKIYS